jgi:DNA polymerase (family 10)
MPHDPPPGLLYITRVLDKAGVARALREIGAYLELDGENPFKVRAYENGARAVEGLAGDLGAVIAAGQLLEVKGIGEALAKKIAELHATGTTDVLERLRESHPPGILELVRIPDLGPKKAATLRAALDLRSVEDLERACLEGRVRGVKGFGEKMEARLLEGIRALRARDATPARWLLAAALDEAGPLLAHLRGAPGIGRAEVAGSTRRARETVGGLDLVVAAAPEVAAASLGTAPRLAGPVARAGPRATARLVSGLPVEVLAVPPERFAAALAERTGSAAHRARLAALAGERGVSLAGPFADEAALYAALGLPFVPPELREDRGEVEAALAGTLPADLVALEDVRGMVHCHTNWSDGRATLEEMARAAEALGAQYLTVTDHSRSAGYAGGLDADRLRRQWDEIARVQERVKIRLLRGTESDILDDGALDYPDAVLEQLDVIVASVHARLRMGEDEMTRRLVRCMSLPVFKIWGHALGRLLLERDAFACRVPEVLDALAASRGAVEVNGDPRRLELDPGGLREATARGIPVVLSVDAHSVRDLGHLPFAVATARRGGVRRGQVLNTLGAEAFRAAVRPAA